MLPGFSNIHSETQLMVSNVKRIKAENCNKKREREKREIYCNKIRERKKERKKELKVTASQIE